MAQKNLKGQGAKVGSQPSTSDDDEDEHEKPLDPKEIPAKVKRWLSRHGKPLEMRVARLFREAKCKKVVQSEFYETLNEAGEKIWREIDVAAQMATTLRRPNPKDSTKQVQLFPDVFFVCECKNNIRGTRPWLVFTDRTAQPTNWMLITSHLMTPLGFQLMHRLCVESDFEDEHGLEFFKARHVGYAVAQANLAKGSKPRDNFDSAYGAINEVLSGAKAKSDPPSMGHQVFRYVVPVIVTTAPLFECYLDSSGETQIEAQEEMTVLWRNPGVGLADVIFYIVTEGAMPRFIEKAQAFANKLATYDQDMLEVFKLMMTSDP